ncbi:MAG TPA: carbon storage regulator [Isosphaeraceae bacterium]|nr:carbon storage regulator [Isosphaeraceae bacterium]
MLVLSRKLNEKIVINGNIFITVVGLGNNQVRLGIEAPDSVGIFRQELLDRAGTSARHAGLATAGVANQNDVR